MVFCALVVVSKKQIMAGLIRELFYFLMIDKQLEVLVAIVVSPPFPVIHVLHVVL